MREAGAGAGRGGGGAAAALRRGAEVGRGGERGVTAGMRRGGIDETEAGIVVELQF